MKTGFRLSKNLMAAVGFLIPLALFLLVTLVPRLRLEVPEPILHLVLTITAVMGIHLLDRLVLFRETFETLQAITDGIQHDIREQTKSLADSSTSLQAMNASGIAKLYARREDAAVDMRRDLIDSANTSIRMIGVSLNDFIRSAEKTLDETWTDINRFIKEDRNLDIKLLIVDPECFGAQMRSRREAGEQESIVGRLGEDVMAVAASLDKIEKKVKGEKKRVRFECRFYRIAPILFLCEVDSACYVQQYYFWSQRNAARESPVVRFRKTERAADSALMYEGMRDHFDSIWEHASIPIAEVLEAKSIGYDKGLHQSGIRNIFVSGGEGRSRIQRLLEHAEREVWIQGVSLRSFFEPGPLFKAIVQLMVKEKVDVKVLLIDRDCEQATYRSYRERLFADSELSFEAYFQSGQHRESALYRDTGDSIFNLRMQMKALRNKMGKSWQPKLHVRAYATAPACFMLGVDDSVLVEQYHYGKIVPDDQQEAPAILGKDMPLIEYQRSSSALYDPIELRSPFSLLRNHFEFAFNLAREIDLNA